MKFNNNHIVILDLFSGLGATQRREKIENLGFEYWTLDINPDFDPDIVADICEIDLSPHRLFQLLPKADFIWASPPCEAFSVSSIGKHWYGDAKYKLPKTDKAIKATEIVGKTIRLIEEIKPSKGFLIENPRGVLRKLNVVQNLPRHTVTYCQYGEQRMKPTDLWGHVPNWNPKPPCKNGDPCHVRAPRGSQTGTQGMGTYAEKSVVPWPLWAEILEAIKGEE